MRYIAISILFFLLSHLLYCQQNGNINQILKDNFSNIETPILSKIEMYEDFDTLCYLLKEVYPYYDIKKQLFSTNYDEKIAELRNKISTIHETDDFVWILYQTINLVCDKHLEIPHPQSLNYYLKNNDKATTKLTSENIVCTYKYYLLTHDSLYVHMKLGLRFKYINGNYYLLTPFYYKNKLYPEGISLKSIDSISVNTFVNQYYMDMPGVSFDNKNANYFSDYFFLSPDFIHRKTHLLFFEDEKNNFWKDTFSVNIPIDGSSKRRDQEDERSVFTIFDSILYVHMPLMDDENFYIQKIQNLFNQDVTRKIIIDLRGNRGGMDKVWREVLSTIVSDTIQQKILFYANNTKQIRDYLHKSGFDFIQTEYLPLLESEKIKISEGINIISPRENSIHFSGKIIILQDENTFSAAGSFLTIAKEDEAIITIGYDMNDIGGRGLTPLLFQLPHTKMLVRIPFIIDYSNIHNMSDFFKNIPQIECERSITDFLQRYYSNNPYQLESLLQDKCFLQAIFL